MKTFLLALVLTLVSVSAWSQQRQQPQVTTKLVTGKELYQGLRSMRVEVKTQGVVTNFIHPNDLRNVAEGLVRRRGLQVSPTGPGRILVYVASHQDSRLPKRQLYYITVRFTRKSIQIPSSLSESIIAEH